MFESYSDVVTPKDLQKMLDVGRNTVYELLRSETIPNIKIGRQIRISKQAVVEYIAVNSRKE